MNDQAAPITELEPPAPEWAVVEIMGHREHAGLIREVDRFGTSLLEVREYGVDDQEPYRVHQYGGSSIFSLTPCTEEYARKTCDQKWKYSRAGSTPLLAWEQNEDDQRDPMEDFADDYIDPEMGSH